MEQLSNQNFQQRNLIEQTVVQLNKDLIPCGFTVAWSGDTFSAYQDIIMQLEVIKKCLRMNRNKYSTSVDLAKLFKSKKTIYYEKILRYQCENKKTLIDL